MKPLPAQIAAEIHHILRHELEVEWQGDSEELLTGLDSLVLLSLVVALEDRFRVAIGEEEGAAVRSVADLARLVAQKIEASPRGGEAAS